MREKTATAIERLTKLPRRIFDFADVHAGDGLPALMLKYGSRFGVQTHEAIVLLIREGLAGQAVIVGRSYFELTTRLSWCSRDESGERWKAQAAKDVRQLEVEWETFRDEKTFPGVVQSGSQKILALLHRMKPAEEVGKPPSLETILKEIHEDDERRGRVVENRSGPSAEYAALYRDPCHSAHGNCFGLAVSSEEKELAAARGLIVAASLRLLETAHFELGVDVGPLASHAQEVLEGNEAEEGMVQRK